MKAGVFVYGKCVGFVSESWARNGKSGMNHKLGISREYQGQFGQIETDVTTIDVAADAVDKIKKQAELYRDQPVSIRVVPMAKAGGKTGAFQTYFAPKDSELIVQPNSPVGVKPAAAA